MKKGGSRKGIDRVRAQLLELSAAVFVKGPGFLESNLPYLVLGLVILSLGSSSILLAQTPPPATPPEVDTAAIDEAICWILRLQEGSFGALLAAVSGIGAVVASAMGGYKMAINCLVVCLGSFMIAPIAELMFGYLPDCGEVLKVPTL